MYKKALCLLACVALAFGLTACAEPEPEGPDYADDEAMEILAEGYEKILEVAESQPYAEDDAMLKKNFVEAYEAEVAIIDQLKDRQFEDSKLQEKVIAYINSIHEYLNILDTYPISSIEFYEAWEANYDKSASMIKDFVENYGFTIDEKYQDKLDEVLVHGKAATEKAQIKEDLDGLIAGASWELVDQGYGSYVYSAVIENTTDYTFENVGLIFSLYDAEGVKTEDSYASTQNWAPGQKVRFEAYVFTEVSDMEVAVDYYSVAK